MSNTGHNLFSLPRLVASSGRTTCAAPQDCETAIAVERARLHDIRTAILARLEADSALLIRCDRALSFLATGGEA